MSRQRGEHGWFQPGAKSYDWLLEYPVITEWIDSYTSENSRKGLLRCLAVVLKEIGKSPVEFLEMSDKDIKSAVKKIAQSYLQRGKAAYGRKIMISVNSFLQVHDRELKLKRTERIRVPAKRVTYEYIPNIIEVYRIADAAESLRTRALILCLFQSGVRINCLCNWNYSHVVDQLYPKIKLPIRLKITNTMDTKLSGYGLPYYITFLGEEAAATLRQYLESRKKKGWIPKLDDPVFVTESSASRGRRMKTGGISDLIKYASELAGFNPESIWTHVIRKSFRKALNKSSVDEDTKEALMGHVLPGSRGNYFDYHDVDEVAEKYMLVDFSRNGTSRRMNGLQERLSDAQREIERLIDERQTEKGKREELEELVIKALKRIDTLEGLVKG